MLKRRWAVACLLVGMVFRAGAQGAGPECTLGSSFVGAYNALGISKAAFTVTVKSSREQQLADGSYIRSSSRSQIARDGAGRLMMQLHQRCVRGEDGLPKLQWSVWVIDEKTGANLQWEVGDPAMAKEARLSRVPRAEPGREKTPADVEAQRKAMVLGMHARDGGKVEDLGTKRIAGVEAQGLRVTTTIPVGAEGNDVPLVSRNEVWTSKDDLCLVLLVVNDDPREGKSTYEVEEVKMGEPDAGLFAPPEGYVVKDVTPVREGGVGGQP